MKDIRQKLESELGNPLWRVIQDHINRAKEQEVDEDVVNAVDQAVRYALGALVPGRDSWDDVIYEFEQAIEMLERKSK